MSFVGFSIAFNILCLIGCIYYIYRISQKLDCGLIWVSFTFSVICRLEIEFFTFLSAARPDGFIIASLKILNGLTAFTAFYSLHERIRRAMRQANGTL